MAAVPAVDRNGIAAELEGTCRDLHALLAEATPALLRRRSNGPRWTNEQLLFHMVFGFLVVRRLLPLVRLVSRLPAPVGRGFAAFLDAMRAQPLGTMNSPSRSPMHITVRASGPVCCASSSGTRADAAYPRCVRQSAATTSP